MLPNGEIFNEREWKIAKKRAKAMYDHVCAICDKQLDADAKAFTHNSIEVDHRIALARGGHPYALENLQLTCMRCNRKKGKKLASDYSYSQAPEALPISSSW